MITGKVTFVEKFGTGEPNSTGAYELDLSVTNNFTLAWRPMHVKTDVFCSAGLILPDVVGRQIDVGGVRTYILFCSLQTYPCHNHCIPCVIMLFQYLSPARHTLSSTIFFSS